MISRGLNQINKNVSGLQKTTSLNYIAKQNKISWYSTNPYNKRWEFKWKKAYYTYPRDGDEHTSVRTPQEAKDSTFLYSTWVQDVVYRWIPHFRMLYERRHRCYDNFNTVVLPSWSLFFYQFSDLALGFKMMTFIPWCLMYVRIRDRTLDPDMKETYLRDMIYQNEEITKLFSEETMHVLDYDFEYDQGYQCPTKFPEFENKVFRFFNTDTSMCTGHFKMGDVESGATMNLKFKTMPVPGKFRFQVGEPYYFYSLVAEITHNGVYKEVSLVDETATLKRIRPFLFLI